MSVTKSRGAKQTPCVGNLGAFLTLGRIAFALLFTLLPGLVYAAVPNPPTNSPPMALDIWSFSDTTNWVSDSGFAPISFTNITWSPIGSGKALVVDSTNAAWLRYKYIENDGTNEITVDKGTVMFWFAPNWTSTNQSSGPHQLARFIELGTYTTNASYGWWSIYCDQGGTNIYFAGQTNNGSTAVYLKAPISWTISNQWHHVALTYSSTNSALYLDGVLATNGLAVTYRPGTNVLTNGFCIGSDSTGIAQVRGTIDDVETFNYVLDADTIAQLFNDTQMNYYLNPWNIANIASAPSTPTNSPVFEAITGKGYLNPIGTVQNCYVSSTAMLTNVIATVNSNGTINLTFSLVGGSNSVYYDVFATAALKYPITNAAWAWMGQGYHCTTYQITNLGAQAAFLIAGSPVDSDNDGLTDAYENLVSHSDPQNPDTAGVGMLDGWQIAYLSGIGGDPYALCGCGDGWTIGQAFAFGWDPREFHTPPAPSGLTVHYGVTTNQVKITWNPSPGPVTNYLITRTIPELYTTTTFSVPATTTNFQDNPFPVIHPELGWDPPTYQATAQYPGGNSTQSAPVPLYSKSWSATIVRGPGGRNVLAVSALPTEVVLVRVVQTDYLTLTNNFDIPILSITNGIYTFPDGIPSPELGTLTINGLDANGKPIAFLGEGQASAYPFLDAREQLKENLVFQLRSAFPGEPCSFAIEGDGQVYELGPQQSGYVLSHFYNVGEFAFSAEPWAQITELRPYIENYAFRNLVFSPSLLNSAGSLTTGLYVTNDAYGLTFPPMFWFTYGQSSLTPQLAAADSRWLFCRSILKDWGVIQLNWPYYTLPTVATNFYGLPYESVQEVYPTTNGLQYSTLYHNNALTMLGQEEYPEITQPQLRTIGYYFCQPYSSQSSQPVGLFPGHSAFSITNSAPLLIVPFGFQCSVAGYAIQRVTNGAPSVLTYLGQYFDKAYSANPDGSPSTNQTGVLSEYGDFFPTQPGSIVLTTKPDLTQTNALPGKCTVNVIKLQLDVNHDGIMDLTYAGPDNTSAVRPYRFWINSDDDASAPTGDYLGADVDTPGYPDFATGIINSQRDLEDFARLWICGVPALTNSGYQVTFDWTDVSSGSPSIKLFKSVETNGGIGYLTSTNIAAAQLSPTNFAVSIGTVTNGATFTFPYGFFTNASTKYLLFEGAGIGSGQLVMSVIKNGQVLAQTAVWLDLHNIEDFYEQVQATNVTSSYPPSDLTSQYKVVHYGSGTGDETKQIIVYLHGINRPPWGAQNEGETMFKRLYWSGYHGHFAMLKWPCTYLPPNNIWPYTFNLSEFYAYKSSTALKNYLTDLRSRSSLAGYAIDVIGHSQGNAVVSEALSKGAPFDNYILSQGAVPAHCFDGSAPSMPALVAADTQKPTPFYSYQGGYYQCWTNIAGYMVNFYNTNDFALKSGSYFGVRANWEVNQETEKPQSFTLGPTYSYWPASGQSSRSTFSGNQQVTDSEEIRSMVARSESAAIGAQNPTQGQPSQGIIRGAVDLFAQFGFSNTRPEHSAQYTRPIQSVWGYYDEILVSAGIQPINR